MVSVIVPVYNCGDYLERCLGSLAEQTYENCRFVVVDDGSMDNSGDIARRFEKNDSRFLLLSQKNSGVAMARNAGLAAAKGEYIAFVDGDDYVSPDYIAALLSAITSTGADVAVADYDMVYKTHTQAACLGLRDGLIEGENTSRRYWLELVAPSPVLWNKLFQRQLIERSGASFRLGSGEDYLFNTALAPWVSRAVTVGKSLYSYVQRGGSIMRSTAPVREGENLIDAFLRYQAEDSSFAALGDDAYNLLGAMAITALIHSGEAIGRGRGYYSAQLDKLAAWPGWKELCRSLAGGQATAILQEQGAMGSKFPALLRMVFTPAALGMRGLSAAMLPPVQRAVEGRKRGNRKELL